MQCHSRPPRSNLPCLATPERSSTNTTAYAALLDPPQLPEAPAQQRSQRVSIPPWFDFAGYQFVIRAPNIESVERFAAAFGYLARQESVGYHRVEPTTVGERAEWLALHELPEEVRPQVLSQTNAVEIELDHAATVEEVKRLYNAIGRIAQRAGFDRDDLPIIPTRRGLRILNFSELDGRDW